MTVAEVLAQARARYARLAELGEYNAQASEVLELYRLLIGLGEAVEVLVTTNPNDRLAALLVAAREHGSSIPLVNARDKPSKTKG